MATRQIGPWLLAAALGAALLAGPCAAQGQTPEIVAQAHFEEGVAHYDARRYEAALRSFRSSLSAVASPNSRLYVARSLRQLGRLAEAVSVYHLTRREAADRADRNPRYAQTREAAEQEREALLSRVGWITLTIADPPAGLSISLAGRRIPEQAVGVEIPVDPGRASLSVEASGFAPFRRRLNVEAGERQTVRVELRPPGAVEEQESAPAPAAPPEPVDPRRRRNLMAGTLVTAGLAVAGGVVFAALAGSASALDAELEQECGGPCPPDRAEDIERGRNLQLGANLSLGFALAAAAAAIVLAIVTPWRLESGEELASLGGSNMVLRW